MTQCIMMTVSDLSMQYQNRRGCGCIEQNLVSAFQGITTLITFIQSEVKVACFCSKGIQYIKAFFNKTCFRELPITTHSYSILCIEKDNGLDLTGVCGQICMCVYCSSPSKFCLPKFKYKRKTECNLTKNNKPCCKLPCFMSRLSLLSA